MSRTSTAQVSAAVPPNKPRADYQPDELDWKIIDILAKEDATNSSVARRLDITEGTVRSRLKRLRQHGIIRVRALINPEVIADQQLATLAIVLYDSHLLDAKAREIAQWPVNSLREIKRSLRLHHLPAIDAAINAEQAGMARQAGSPENIEAIMAFMEKRPPNFRKL